MRQGMDQGAGEEECVNGTCKGCKHWRKNVEPSALERTSTCLRVQTSGGYATGLESGTKAIVMPGGARLHTGPDFSCNQWEAK